VIYPIVHALQGIRDASGTEERTTRMNNVDQALDFMLFLTGFCRFVVQAGPIQIQQATLTHDG
jgi:hypothetical protein